MTFQKILHGLLDMFSESSIQLECFTIKDVFTIKDSPVSFLLKTGWMDDHLRGMETHEINAALCDSCTFVTVNMNG